MENKEVKLNKSFKFNQQVYVLMGAITCEFDIVKGRVAGVRELSTANSKVIYLIDTPFGRFEVKPYNVYESVQEIAADLENHVIK
jgi:hypothetical protein